MKLIVNGRILNLFNTQIMGILNVSPDSFFDGNLYNTIPKAIDHVGKMISYGATLIDIGGESTRPGSERMNELEELERTLPIVQEVVKRFDIFVSINTSSALVMRECAMLGVHLINDIRSFDNEESMKVAAWSKMAVCLMHMQGDTKTMQHNPSYFNIIHEVNSFFIKQISRCEKAGIDKNKLVIDPGFGFGKTVIHNYQLLSKLKYFQKLNLPILIGVSRKSMINPNQLDPKKKLIGSIACAVIAAMKGVHIIRVHDVKETMEALQIVKIIRELKKIRKRKDEFS